MDRPIALAAPCDDATLAGDMPCDGGVGCSLGGGWEVTPCGRIDFVVEADPTRRGAPCRFITALCTADGWDWP